MAMLNIILLNAVKLSARTVSEADWRKVEVAWV